MGLEKRLADYHKAAHEHTHLLLFTGLSSHTHTHTRNSVLTLTEAFKKKKTICVCTQACWRARAPTCARCHALTRTDKQTCVHDGCGEQ